MPPTLLTDDNAAHPQPSAPNWLRRRLAVPPVRALAPPTEGQLARDPFLAFAQDPVAGAARWAAECAAADTAQPATQAPATSPAEAPTLHTLLAHLTPPETEAPDTPERKSRLTRRHLEPRHKRALIRAALDLPIPDAEPAHLTPVRAWRPMTNTEWAALEPFIRNDGPGRPVRDPRLRLNLIFAVTTKNLPWREAQTLAANGCAMTGDTLSRQFRRWTHAGLWKTLLFALTREDCPPALKSIEYWLLRAARRAMRLMGQGALFLARLLGKLTALPLPPALLPNPILSEAVEAAQIALYRRGWRVAHEPVHRLLDAIRLATWRQRPWLRRLAPA